MKKLFVLALVMALAVSLSPTATASERYITGMDEEIFKAAAYIDGRRWRHLIGSSNLEDIMEVRPGTTIFMAFSSRDFIWSDSGNWPDMNMDFVRRHNITVTGEMYNEDGIRILESVSIEEFAGWIGVMFRFADTVASVDAVEFSLKGEVTASGCGTVASNGRAAFTLSGTFRNRSVAISQFSNTVRLGPGRTGVIHTIPPASVRYDIGTGVAITASPDRHAYQVYGVARILPAPRNIRLTWPAVEQMITIETIGINNGRVNLSLDHTYYVYGPGMNYLGTSGDSLPQLGMYYLSRVRF